MTYVELFDSNVMENICTCLVAPPEKVVFLGNKIKEMTAHKERYESFFRGRGINTVIEVCSVNRNDMNAVVGALDKIVQAEAECTIDITGGDDVFLVAVGIILERYREKGSVQVHRYNIRNGSFMDCDQDGKTLSVSKLPKLTFAENLLLYGGCTSGDDDSGAEEWEMTESFKSDVEKMWKICSKDTKRWNSYTNFLSSFELISKPDDDPLGVIIPRDILKKRWKDLDPGFFELLRMAGLLTEFSLNEKVMRLKYKNNQVKRCLQKAGQVLELKVFILASETEDDGEAYFNDVATGADIVWLTRNGDVNKEQGESVHNEIDVVMMKNMIPVFVSCKNGYFDSEELFKLKSVAEKFGGKYSKKILITSNTNYADILNKRATEMGISILTFTENTPDSSIVKKLRNIAVN